MDIKRTGERSRNVQADGVVKQYLLKTECVFLKVVVCSEFTRWGRWKCYMPIFIKLSIVNRPMFTTACNHSGSIVV